MKQLIVTLSFLSISLSVYCQFERIEFETDSSNVELIRNSVYRVWEESFKEKDSVFYSVRFINDTTQINTEGWKNKEGKYLGVWKEFNEEGKLMYERDHDDATCKINKSLYPYHDLLEQMKENADSFIITAYSNDFFEYNVRFNFNCTAYDKDGYVGTWIEPLKRKPTKFLFRYQVKLQTSDWYDEMIGIELDEKGNYIPNKGFWNNYGFEKIEGQKRIFQIDKNKAIESAKGQGLRSSNTNEVDEFLTWERFKKAEFYNGQFRYYITELVEKIDYQEGENRKGIVFKFNVYSFNPWTGEFIEKKKMKSIKEWGENSGHSTGLIPDNE